MRSRLAALSPVALVLGILILGWLQWRWIDRVAEADLESERTRLTQAAGRIAAELDTEITRAILFFSPGPPAGDRVEQLSSKIHEWNAAAAWPNLVREIVVVNEEGPAQRVGTDGQVSVTSAPSVSLHDRDPGAHHNPVLFAGAPAFPLGPGPMRVWGRGHPPGPPPPGFAAPRFPPPPRSTDFLVINADAVTRSILPALAERHLPSPAYRAHLIRRDEPSSPGQLGIVTAGVGALRPGCLLGKGRSGRRGPRPGRGGRQFGPGPPEGRGHLLLRLRSACMDGTPLEGGWWVLALTHSSGVPGGPALVTRNRNRAVALAGLCLLAGALAALLVASRPARDAAQGQIEFAMSVSHELKTPLTVMRLAGDNLASGIVPAEAARRYGETIRKEAERLSGMVDQVLTFARTGRPDWTAETSPVSPDAIVDAAVAAAEPVLKETSIDLVREIDRDLPLVSADLGLATSALTNLIVNAVRHGGAGRWVRVRAFAERDTVVFEVADRGPGISARDVRRVFRPFVRGMNSGGTRGAGLGLHLVKRIAEAHGGSAEIESSTGHGTAVRIRLPAASAPVLQPTT
ncbi:MAG TPA: HAMP domain-containing sensor histidine kinase [Bryobacteraceae bacterium]|nr:HAMP domain-containing sensor histidine kinase [Bryobacteraceae bacterium]